MNKVKIELKWTGIYFLLILVWMFLERISGLHDEHIALHPLVTMFFLIPAIAVYVLAIRDKKRQLGGRLTYKEGLISGLILTLGITILSPVAQWVISYVITPDFFTNAISASVELGYYSNTAEAEAYFNFENYLKQSVQGSLMFGVIKSLIIPLFLRSKA